jgi:16S rRNA (cytosine967-C5)-methyltransferase
VIAPARLAAYEILLAVGRGSVDLGAAVAGARSRLGDERDRALAGEIATGTLRWQGAFDHVIAEFARRPPSRLDPEVLTILRLSIFQLLHLDRVPAAAAVDDAVQMTRKAGKRSAAPFVNALLRRVSRERDRLPLPSRPSAPRAREAWLTFLSATLSHPLWLVDRWSERYGYEATESWARFNNAPAPLTLRANTLRTSREDLQAALSTHGVRTEPTSRAPQGLVVLEGNPLGTPLAHDGLFVVQDEASQLVAEFVNARPGERVLDACASPGNKTTGMAAAMRDRGLVVAADARPRRMRLLARTVRASGARTVRLVHLDAARPLPFGAVFDAVLVDAPCSGLGTVRRDPDIKWRRSPDEFDTLAALQLDILRATAAVVRPGGRLVYSTCSSEPEENDEVVDAFLAEHPRFRLEGAPLRTLPFRDGLEAFYAARLVDTGAPAVHS